MRGSETLAVTHISESIVLVVARMVLAALHTMRQSLGR
jgi:hypothetical protein